ncbi:MAG: hypothetical protein KY476_06095 [Planctomycetes bacterium]|nr:hypothetical protein [Planctomycetota bacterium]
MNKLAWLAGAALVAVLLYLAAALVGLRGQDAAGGEGPDEVVYVCREAKTLVSAPPQPTPAVNPATGRRTLVRALYCRDCDGWRAVPPTEAYGGNPLSHACPRHRQPMSPTGPLTAPVR